MVGHTRLPRTGGFAALARKEKAHRLSKQLVKAYHHSPKEKKVALIASLTHRLTPRMKFKEVLKIDFDKSSGSLLVYYASYPNPLIAGGAKLITVPNVGHIPVIYLKKNERTAKEINDTLLHERKHIEIFLRRGKINKLESPEDVLAESQELLLQELITGLHNQRNAINVKRHTFAQKIDIGDELLDKLYGQLNIYLVTTLFPYAIMKSGKRMDAPGKDPKKDLLFLKEHAREEFIVEEKRLEDNLLAVFDALPALTLEEINNVLQRSSWINAPADLRAAVLERVLRFPERFPLNYIKLVQGWPEGEKLFNQQDPETRIHRFNKKIKEREKEK